MVSNLHTFPNLSNADSRINFCNVKQQHIQDSHKYLKWSSFYQNLNGWTKKLHHWCLWEFWIANWNLYRKWNIFDCFKWAKYRCFDPLSLNFKFGNYWTHWNLESLWLLSVIKQIEIFNNRYTGIKSALRRLMKITEIFNTSHPGWLEYMANKIDIILVLKII